MKKGGLSERESCINEREVIGWVSEWMSDMMEQVSACVRESVNG